MAFDEMDGELPRTPELLATCGTSEAHGYPTFNTIAEYDVLNCCYTNVEIGLRGINARESVIWFLEENEYKRFYTILPTAFHVPKQGQKRGFSGTGTKTVSYL